MAEGSPASRGGRRPSRGRHGAGKPRDTRARQPRDPARRVAYDVLRAVDQRDAYANLLLGPTLAAAGVSGRDAALATELTYGTLRRQGTYDAVLDACVDRSLTSVDAEVLPALRLGAHQLLSMNVPAHAAVSATVDLARGVAGPHRARFVNAVLRKVSARDLSEWVSLLAPDRASDPVGELALRQSHPRWIVTELARALGETPGDGLAETERLLVAQNERPGVTLLAKPGRATPADLDPVGATPGRFSPYAAYLPQGDPAELTEVRQGRVAVADEGSQMTALALTRVRVEGDDAVWLDACAGPGGKAALLAGLAGRRDARLLAGELRPHRATMVAGTVDRSVKDAARVVIADATRPAWRDAAFDRVLVDAPCTGLGALRRRPESRWRRAAESVGELVPLQRELLARAIDATRPGGVVAYVTCSPVVAETQEVVAAIHDERDDVEILRAADYLSEVPDIATGPDGLFAQFWPHRHGTDAMFLALLRRR
ncbi:rRNA cytosine-C5-methyltransferase [Spiractinospora alimapuensis]|nr:transcription antitermination factor NusB [Spiractinospora alimapuensis]QVQ53187.1 rRNA cytosine-C5-methyltransferase [Spiractinospora alimapuensis]